MSFEIRLTGGDGRTARGDPESSGAQLCGGWELMQRDWSLRQGDSVRPVRRIARLRARLAAAASWLRRLLRSALGIIPADGEPETPRSSAPRS